MTGAGIRLVFAVVLFASPAVAAGHRQSACAFSDGGAVSSFGLGLMQVAPGSVLVVLVQRNDVADAGEQLTDSLGTRFTRVASIVSGQRSLSAWAGVADAGGTDSFSVQLSAAEPVALHAYELEGLSPSPLQVVADAGSTGGTGRTSSLSLGGPAYVLGHALSNGSVNSVALPLVTRQSCWGNLSADLWLPDGGALAPSFDVTPGAIWLAQVLAFGPPGTGGGGGAGGGAAGGGDASAGGGDEVARRGYYALRCGADTALVSCIGAALSWFVMLRRRAVTSSRTSAARPR